MSIKKKILIVANWKANPETLKRAKEIFSSIKKRASKYKNVEVVVCPSSVHLHSLKNTSSSISLGAQDFFPEPSGAFTGFIGYEALLETKIKYAIIGHSERRALGETNEMVSKKLLVVLQNKVKPILCIGEIVRDPEFKYLDFIKEELIEAFYKVPKSQVHKVVVAYEPLWAVGKNAKRDATPPEVKEIVIFIKRVIGDLYKTKSVPPIKILYGGSVFPENVKDILTNGGVDGILIGRASLDPKKFGEILEIANSIRKNHA